MTDKELRKLKRIALIELLIDQMEENQRLRTRLTEMEKLLRRQEYVLANAGFPSEVELSEPVAHSPQPPEEPVEAMEAVEAAAEAEARVRDGLEEIWQALDRAEFPEGRSAPKRLRKEPGQRWPLDLSELTAALQRPTGKREERGRMPDPELANSGNDELSAALMRMMRRNQ